MHRDGEVLKRKRWKLQTGSMPGPPWAFTPFAPRLWATRAEKTGDTAAAGRSATSRKVHTEWAKSGVEFGKSVFVWHKMSRDCVTRAANVRLFAGALSTLPLFSYIFRLRS